MEQNNMKSICITIKEAAKMLGLCENTFRQLLGRKDFPKIRVGRRILIPRDSFHEYISSMTQNPEE